MSKREDGGPAFPGPYDFGLKEGDKISFRNYYGCPIGGMTLRQWYAGLAMQAMLNTDLRREQMATMPNIARNCFEMADAMIREGKKE